MDDQQPALRSRRLPAGFLLLAGLVVTGSVAVRLALLDRQSYWIDELFSAQQAAGSLSALLTVGSTEVHTPFYAGLLWLWSRIGGSQEDWTRLLSTLFAVLAVAVSYRGLRTIGFSEQLRWALTAAIAAGGTSMVYSLETRSYALLLLGSAGLTLSTLRAGLLTLDREVVPGQTLLAWGGWVTFTATVHLFGAVLTLAAVIVLTVLIVGGPAGSRAHRTLFWLGLAAAGCTLQAAWILAGLSRPGFAGGTSWIQAPDRWDVWTLVTTTFSAGDLRPQKDGFAWASPVGTIVIVALGLVAAGHGYRTRERSVEAPPAAAFETAPAAVFETRPASVEARAAVILLALASIVIGLVFVISQWAHLWTLRNMVIVTPALTWGMICLVVAAAGTDTARRQVATVVVALLGIGLIPIAGGLAQPYKTDFRGLLDYLISVRAEQPGAEFVFLGGNPPTRWTLAGNRAADDPAWPTLYRDAAHYRRATAYRRPAPGDPAGGQAPVTTIITYYHGVASPRLDERAAALVARLGPGCRRVPIYGVIVVRCD
jgi:hypothetical protein